MDVWPGLVFAARNTRTITIGSRHNTPKIQNVSTYARTDACCVSIGKVARTIHAAVPPADYRVIAKTLHEITQNSSGGKLTFGLVFALLSGSGGMTQLIATLNAAYNVHEERSWSRVHSISLALTIAMSLLIIVALFLVLAGGKLIAPLGALLGLNRAALIAAKALQWVL